MCTLPPLPPWVLGCASPSPHHFEKVPVHVVDLETCLPPGSGTGQRRDLKGLMKKERRERSRPKEQETGSLQTTKYIFFFIFFFYVSSIQTDSITDSSRLGEGPDPVRRPNSGLRLLSPLAGARLVGATSHTRETDPAAEDKGRNICLI